MLECSDIGIARKRCNLRGGGWLEGWSGVYSPQNGGDAEADESDIQSPKVADFGIPSVSAKERVLNFFGWVY